MSSPKFLIMLNMLGNLMIISASSWVTVWVGIEITSMTIPPLIMTSNNSTVSKINSWKYYMIQCYSSSMFMLSILCMSSSSQYWNSSNVQWALIFFSMILKMGILPFHGWLFQLSSSLQWPHLLILSTIQKIGPIIVVGEVYKPLSKHMSVDLMMSATVSIILTSAMMINSIRYFMIISSIINVTWMVSASQVSKYCLLVYITFYFIHLMILFKFLSKEISWSLDSMFFNTKKELLTETFKMVTIMSMMGMPPLTGFFTKILVAEHLIMECQLITSLILMLSSSIITMMYLSMMYMNLLNMQITSIQFKPTYLMSLSTIILSSVIFFI